MSSSAVPTSRSSWPARATLAPFPQTGLPPEASSIERLRALLTHAGSAERNHHRPELATHALRADLAYWSQREEE